MFPRIIFSDFDGTLTHGSSLGSIFFEILDFISHQKSQLVIVTGRPLSWGHFLLSHTNTSALISEGGGMLTIKDSDHIPQDEEIIERSEIVKLEKFVELLIQRFSKLPLTTDSKGRFSDRAIELKDAAPIMNDLTSFMDKNGIHHSCSNVHLNFWSGEIDKYKAIKYFLQKYKQDIPLSDCIFFGDSKNDESVFKAMENTVGVSNIREILDQITYKPRTILMGDHNEGPAGVLNYLTYLSEK